MKAPKDAARLLTPQWAIDKGNEVGAQNRRELIATGARIIGDIDSLDSAKVPEGESIYPDKISIDLVAEAMIGFDKNLVKRFPLDWVQSNIFNRYKRKVRNEISKLRKKL
ncbi:MAG: hypothetical protein RL421_633 [Actinomycetota bacterium]